MDDLLGWSHEVPKRQGVDTDGKNYENMIDMEHHKHELQLIAVSKSNELKLEKLFVSSRNDPLSCRTWKHLMAG